jgi:hypothetical protein
MNVTRPLIAEVGTEDKEMQTQNDTKRPSTIGAAVQSENMSSQLRLMTLLAVLCVVGQVRSTFRVEARRPRS